MYLGFDGEESVRDSAYGTMSKVASIVAGSMPTEIHEEFLHCFLKDDEASLSFQRAAERTTAFDFENTVRTILERLSNELRGQANNQAEKSAAILVKK